MHTMHPCLQEINSIRVLKHLADVTYNDIYNNKNEPRHDKTNKMSLRPAKTQVSLGIRTV